jgi:hypothetical protein
VCYSVDEDGEIVIDVGMADYSLETLEKFSLLIASIPTHTFQVQSMQILQAAFEKDDKNDEFSTFVKSVILKSTALEEGIFIKGEGMKKRKSGNDPVIKPTDLF